MPSRSLTPNNLADLGVKASEIDDLITMALDDPSCDGNPVPLNRQNLQWLFDTAFDQ
jgi:alcohol dehydrogenase class IV